MLCLIWMKFMWCSVGVFVFVFGRFFFGLFSLCLGVFGLS